MRKASTWMLEKGTQTPSPSPDLIPAEHNNKTLTGNSRANWYIERGHLTPANPATAIISPATTHTNVDGVLFTAR